MNKSEFKLSSELDVFITDLNGHQRGKRVPVGSVDKIVRDGFKLPRSVMGLDFWGDDVLDNGLVFETGDSDGLCHTVTDKMSPVPWEPNEHYQMIATMSNLDGTPFMADPRQILKVILERYTKLGLTPVVAAELEFYLLDIASEQAKRPITSPLIQDSGFLRPNAYAIHDLNRFRPLLSNIRTACELQGVPADAVTAEFGDGQFEFNLDHIPDALLAADHAVLFKRIVRNVARKHGHLASFMAKTYGDESGSGFHLHFSLLDKEGNNVFSNGGPEGSQLLRQAVAGLLLAMPDSMLVFAPHLNSWRRLRPGSHAPIAANWGYENRTVAVRIPEGPDHARRIEHRVAGADANPYLVIAAILSAALYGIEHQLEPEDEMIGNAYDSIELPEQRVPAHWYDAVCALRDSELLKELMGPVFVEVFCAIKEQEHEKFATRVSKAEYETYLGIV